MIHWKCQRATRRFGAMAGVARSKCGAILEVCRLREVATTPSRLDVIRQRWTAQ
ncbi:MAG: hypothetical protein LBI42_10540 [Chitinispirillales bacterium]|jgi:hypothetical protein|nr:hypothetical protein [Chitinispirillales bacterium]